MENYKISLKRSVIKDLSKVPKKEVQRIMKRIGSLAENPRPPQSKKLSGSEYYRIRQGSYRILYSIEDGELIIFVIKVAHRKDVYRR